MSPKRRVFADRHRMFAFVFNLEAFRSFAIRRAASGSASAALKVLNRAVPPAHARLAITRDWHRQAGTREHAQHCVWSRLLQMHISGESRSG